MPLEGQRKRLATPLRPLDRYFIAAVACAAVLGAGAGVYAYAGHPSAPSGKSCVVVTVASSMGSATLRNCGAAAERFCQDEGTSSGAIAAACRRRGLDPGPVRGKE
jgi:hypothetical protein